jgi:hypothetical protein
MGDDLGLEEATNLALNAWLGGFLIVGGVTHQILVG